MLAALLSACESDDISRFDIATLVLACSALVMTGVGVFVALLTFWGYRDIRKSAIKAAVEKAVPIAEKAAQEVARSVVLRYIVDPGAELETTPQQAAEIIRNLDNTGSG